MSKDNNWTEAVFAKYVHSLHFFILLLKSSGLLAKGAGMDASTAAMWFWAILFSTYVLSMCCNYGTKNTNEECFIVGTAPHNGLPESASETWNAWGISHRDELERGVCKLREGCLFSAVVLHLLRLASTLPHLKSLRFLTFKDFFFNQFKRSFIILFIYTGVREEGNQDI
jgi:hypothetical protein